MCGNLLDDLDEATRAEVLEKRFIRRPLVMATAPFAKLIQEELMMCSYFDIQQGRFIRTVANKGLAKCGAMGSVNGSGYITVMIATYTFNQSWLIYLWFKGCLPKASMQMDHIDGNRKNDYPGNLRLVSRSINLKNQKKYSNNTTGYTGVYQCGNKFRAIVRSNKKIIHLGYFATVEEAYTFRQAYIKAHPELGFTVRHGL